MRNLTKSGIRYLTAKYRSILRKCFFINLICLGQITGTQAADVTPLFSTNYDEFVAQLHSDTPLLGTLDKINQQESLFPSSGYTIQKLDSETGSTFSISLPDEEKIYYYKVTKKTSSPLESDDRLFSDKVFDTNHTIISSDKQYVIGDYIGNSLSEVGQSNISVSNVNKDLEVFQIIGTFINNKSNRNGVLYNAESITSILADFINNSDEAINNGGYIGQLSGILLNNYTDKTAGGAIYNKGHIEQLNGILLGNYTIDYDGGGIANIPSGTIDKISSDFIFNRVLSNRNLSISGGAINNTGIIKIISSNFIANKTESYANSYGGAINNRGKINTISGNFFLNTAETTQDTSSGYGGAVYNSGEIGISGNNTSGIIGKFESNSASDGGAIYNSTEKNSTKGTIYFIQADFSNNHANNYGGAIYNDGTVNFVAENNNIAFDGNYVTSGTGKGGAIYNNGGEVGLYAAANHSITFLGKDKTTQKLPSEAKDVDGIYNIGILNINGNGTDTYVGTVNLYNVAGTGTTNIYGGTVNVTGSFAQKELSVKDATLALSEKTVTASKTSPITTSVFTLDNATLNLQNNSTGTVYLGGMRLVGSNNLMLDADLAGEKMDQISVPGISGSGELKISDIRLLSATTEDKVSLDLFADEATRTALKDKVSGNLTGLKYSPTYIYDAKYSTDDGKITFTRTEQANPYLYAPSSIAQTIASITGQIAGLAMDKLDAAVVEGEKGLAAGDMPKASNAWVKVMGFDDDVDFKHFNSIDSKAYTLAAGFNTDKVKFDNFDAAFGLYGGYIGGRQKYTGNKIDQEGGYIGLSSELTKGNAFLLSTVNSGFINNEAENMYGTDKFDTRWLGVGLKGGYNYALTDTWTLQPNVYAGYTFVNTEDYTSNSGVNIKTDNLHLFEIDPGFKLSNQIDKGWIGYIQGKYAIVMDNGGDTKATDVALPDISHKNYFEYGFGMNKSLTDAWSLNGEINRRDGGRSGWNGSVEFKYSF